MTVRFFPVRRLDSGQSEDDEFWLDVETPNVETPVNHCLYRHSKEWVGFYPLYSR
jgi:hypothetical protein